MACQTFPPSPFQVCGAILDKYLQTGGPNGFLLFPKSDELTNPDGFGRRSEFLGGNIYWSADTGAHPVAHEFLTKWGEYGYEGGFIGYPLTDEIVLSDGIGRRQEFQGSWIYWHALTGAHNIQGAIRDKWIESGGERGPLGYPSTDEVVTPDGVGRFNRFERGMVYWSPSTGAHAVSARILTVWSAAGYESSHLGGHAGGAHRRGPSIRRSRVCSRPARTFAIEIATRGRYEQHSQRRGHRPRRAWPPPS